MVAVGYSFQRQAMHRVANAHFGGLLKGYRESRNMGRKRIGCMLARDEDERSRHYWQAAALCAARLHGGAAIAPLMRDESSGADVPDKCFRRHRPDAIIGNNPDHEIANSPESWRAMNSACRKRPGPRWSRASGWREAE